MASVTSRIGMVRLHAGKQQGPVKGGDGRVYAEQVPGRTVRLDRDGARVGGCEMPSEVSRPGHVAFWVTARGMDLVLSEKPRQSFPA